MKQINIRNYHTFKYALLTELVDYYHHSHFGFMLDIDEDKITLLLPPLVSLADQFYIKIEDLHMQVRVKWQIDDYADNFTLAFCQIDDLGSEQNQKLRQLISQWQKEILKSLYKDDYAVTIY